MKSGLNEFIYTRGKDEALDEAFQWGTPYGKVKLGENELFWKAGLRWYVVPMNRVRRAYRRVEFVQGKLCCGRASYDIQSLVLELDDGTSREILIGDNEIGDAMKHKAEALLASLQAAHPNVQYGKA